MNLFLTLDGVGRWAGGSEIPLFGTGFVVFDGCLFLEMLPQKGRGTGVWFFLPFAVLPLPSCASVSHLIPFYRFAIIL